MRCVHTISTGIWPINDTETEEKQT